jgi:hypothetical protein
MRKSIVWELNIIPNNRKPIAWKLFFFVRKFGSLEYYNVTLVIQFFTQSEIYFVETLSPGILEKRN